MNRFIGRYAVVTGGASGIGRATVARFIEEGAEGVAILDFNRNAFETELARYEKGKVIAVYADLSKAEDVNDAFKEINKAFPKIDILVNCAGYAKTETTMEITDESIDRHIDINLKGTVRTCQQVLNGMKERGWGRIINFATGAMYTSNDWLSYGASKAAVSSFSRGVAQEYAPYGITVNTVVPGMIQTEILEKTGWTKEKIDQITNYFPMRRLGKPEEVAGTVAFLASDDSGYITGCNIDVNGTPMA